MHILLINSNPVISRLLVLCTRDDTFFLEEVSSIEEVKHDSYDVVFVDEASHEEGMKDFLEQMSETLKVYISFDALPMSGFDVSIKKPFLPSEIKALFQRAEEEAQTRKEETVTEEPFMFPFSQEEEKSKEESIEKAMEKAIPEAPAEESVPEDTIEKSLVEEATQLLEIFEAEEREEAQEEEAQEEEIQEEESQEEETQEEENKSGEEERFIETLLEEALREEIEEASVEEVSTEASPTEDLIIEDLPIENEKEPEVALEEEQPLSVLNVDEVEKIKALLDMDDTLEVEEALSDEALEARKIEVIKEQLIAEGLEILEEDKIVEELTIAVDGSFEKSEKKKKKKKSKKLKFTEENMAHIEDAVEMAMASMTNKQMKKLLKGKEINIKIKLEGKE